MKQKLEAINWPNPEEMAFIGYPERNKPRDTLYRLAYSFTRLGKSSKQIVLEKGDEIAVTAWAVDVPIIGWPF